MNLSQVLDKQIDSFQALDELIQKSEVNLSILGYRLVTVDGFEGSVRVDTLVEKIYSLCRKKSEFSSEECIAAMKSKRKILHHYEISDEMIKGSSNPIVILFKTLNAIMNSSYIPWYIRMLMFYENPRVALDCDKQEPEIFREAYSKYNLSMDKNGEVIVPEALKA